MSLSDTCLKLPRGAVMADVAGTALTEQEKQRLCHPLVGGVILFKRNFESKDQLAALVKEIKALRQPELVVGVDQEGGRVQRFVDGFTRLPPMRHLGECYDREGAAAALVWAEEIGTTLASELKSCGVDISFTPVLDLDWGRSGVIGDRSFHRSPQVVAELALALQKGLNAAGMKSCGKHFPGHGYAEADSHLALPTDERDFAAIWQEDLLPFRQLIENGMAAVMPAHIVYTQMDTQTAGFSRFWLQEVLRGKLGFQGAIFSDDLTMAGAAAAGSIGERARRALEAGCDILLVCNRPDLVDELLENLAWTPPARDVWQPLLGV